MAFLSERWSAGGLGFGARRASTPVAHLPESYDAPPSLPGESRRGPSAVRNARELEPSSATSGGGVRFGGA